jgi:hypothetical protein
MCPLGLSPSTEFGWAFPLFPFGVLPSSFPDFFSIFSKNDPQFSLISQCLSFDFSAVYAFPVLQLILPPFGGLVFVTLCSLYRFLGL